MTAMLSGLTEAHLRGSLSELRRIAALDDAAALAALDTFAWGLSEAIADASEAGPDTDDWLGQSREERAARFQQELAQARTALEYPAGIRPFDGMHLRNSTGIYYNDTARREALAVADELDVAYAGAELARALTVQVGSTASLPKYFRLIDIAIAFLQDRDDLGLGEAGLPHSASFAPGSLTLTVCLVGELTFR
ncbi:MAG: hypothetical protein ACREOQ_14465 [Gemmatimonadales bacterium]